MKLALIFLFAINIFAFEIQHEVSPREFSKMGLDKLEKRELDYLNFWLSNNQKFKNSHQNKTQLEITYAKDEEIFKIGGVIFRANTYCPDWSFGDIVFFVKGDLKNCENVIIKNLNQNNECKLSCK